MENLVIGEHNAYPHESRESHILSTQCQDIRCVTQRHAPVKTEKSSAPNAFNAACSSAASRSLKIDQAAKTCCARPVEDGLLPHHNL